ncbi:MAG: hypothetical protein QOD98_1091 [Nocardioidaceae bacterium]|nr:hypothetical protein [Nocardioidaceae bacterium]
MNIASSTSSRRRLRPLALLLTAVTLLVSGVAAAYWGTAGGGSATAATAGASALTLAPGTPTAQLYPGGQATVVLTVTNPNPGQVRVGSLALDTSQGTSGFAVDGGHSGCGLASLSFATQTNGGAGWTVPGSGVLPVTLTNALSMGTGAANACQGAVFSVYLTAGP